MDHNESGDMSISCLMGLRGLLLLLKQPSLTGAPDRSSSLASHFTFPSPVCHGFSIHCLPLARPTGSFGPSCFPRAVGVYVQSRDHILLTQRHLLGLPGFAVTWREMCFFGPPACSSLCKIQQRAGHWAKLTFHFGTHFRITPWQNIPGGVYLGSKLEKCCFSLRSVSGERTFRACFTFPILTSPGCADIHTIQQKAATAGEREVSFCPRLPCEIGKHSQHCLGWRNLGPGNNIKSKFCDSGGAKELLSQIKQHCPNLSFRKI